jgi:hypothetical protein
VAAERLVGEFATIEHLAAGKALAAHRVAESGRWRRAGERSEAEWLARTTGDSVGAARAALETAARVRALPATDTAFRGGELSGPQACAISSAAAADPASEHKLLGMSESAPLTKPRDACDRIRAAATDGEARRRRIHHNRYWPRWTDGEGARCGQYRMTPDEAAKLEAAAQPFVDAAFGRARAEGREEPSEAYAADRLVDMARAAARSTSDDPTPPRSPAEMVLVVNLE